MEAGKLRHRVTVWTNTETEGNNGQPVLTPLALNRRLPAHVKQLSGRELFNAQQMQSDITHEVSLRWLRGVTSKEFLVWHDGGNERTLNILTPPTNPDGKREEMILMCSEAEPA